MRILQVLPVLAFGDAIGNDTITLKDTLKDAGYKTEIYAEVIDSRLPKATAIQIEKLKVDKEDIILYHLSTGSRLNYEILKYECKKVLIYHNITPPDFFSGYNEEAKQNCIDGLAAVEYLADKVDYCLADSEFNKQELIALGYTCKIDVLPILITFDDFKKVPNKEVLDKYKGNTKNIIFTGRIAPNKKHEDLIAAFYYYQKYYEENARLFLVGSYGGMEKYYEKLGRYAEQLDVKNVIFTGHIKFDEILAYYKLADLLLCMSEHEGFCVPLVEAMYFNVPVVAFESTAIGDTLGGSGILLKEKEPEVTAGVMNRVLTDASLYDSIIKNQQERLLYFQHEKVKVQFLNYLRILINGHKC